MARKLSAMQKWQKAQKEQREAEPDPWVRVTNEQAQSFRGGIADNIERFKINGGEKRFIFNPGGNNGR